MNAYQTLISIAQRSQKVAHDLPSKKDSQAHWMGLGFRLHGNIFVAPLADVVELMHVPVTTHLPGVKHWIVGVANIRGRLMTLIDFSLYFGQVSKRSKVSARTFVVEGDDTYYGLIIDESMGMQHFSRDSRSDDVENVDERYLPYIDGSYHAAGIQWPVMNLLGVAKKIRSESLSI